MGFYATAWRAAVMLCTAVALCSGLRASGGTVLALAAMLALTGGAFGWCWSEQPAAQRRAAARGAVWAGCGGAMVAGLPPVIGSWALLVVVALAATAPAVLAAVRRAVAARRPARERAALEFLSDRELEQVWRSTTRQVRSRDLAPGSVAVLVEERARLLDELERRDPLRFAAWLVTAA